MLFPRITAQYIIWHYTQAFADLARIWAGFLWFVYEFFSIRLMFQTLFYPWRRIQDRRKSTGFDIAEFSSVITVNIIMRIVGFIVRTVLILTGVIALILTLALGVCAFVAWFFMPLIILGLLVVGVMFLFYPATL